MPLASSFSMAACNALRKSGNAIRCTQVGFRHIAIRRWRNNQRAASMSFTLPIYDAGANNDGPHSTVLLQYKALGFQPRAEVNDVRHSIQPIARRSLWRGFA